MLNEVVKQGEASLSIKLTDGSNYVTRMTAQMESLQNALPKSSTATATQ